ncbi:MAG: ABC transporter ATP-binding protein [Prochloraceae cyanobacterium]|nr:ABC transporter ATP-binding protein [Prochloraceae cyanobacterium]
MPIETKNLSSGYDRKLVIKDINLTLNTGEWLSLLGANGSGKSTFLKTIARILKPVRGSVFLDGKLIHNSSPQIIAQKMAILPQQQTIPAGLTVYQLVSLGRTPHQSWWEWELNRNDRQKIAAALQQTQIDNMRDRPVTELSGGERQRAFLALALAQDPQIILLDEPTTYLDINYQLQLLELLKKLQQQRQLTIITVLHEINLAARYSDRLAMLVKGNLYTVGKTAEVLNKQVIADVFDVIVEVIDTPVGLQICPLNSRSN